MIPSTRSPLSDTERQADVLAKLDWGPSVNAAHVGVTVNDGVTTLKGTVDGYAEKLMAEKVVRSSLGQGLSRPPDQVVERAARTTTGGLRHTTDAAMTSDVRPT